MPRKLYKNGFSLVELLVTIAIATLLMSIVLFDYRTFNDRLAVSGASQELSINIRQAQSYGINVKESMSNSGQFNSAFGVYFDPAGYPNSYFIFADRDGDNVYDEGSGCGNSNSECVERVELRNGVSVYELCATVAGVETCPPNGAARYLHVTFRRPNPDAVINFTNNGGNIFYYASWPDVKIILRSPRGLQSTTTIEYSGQIYAN